MNLLRAKAHQVNVEKAALVAIIVNAMEIALVAAFAVYLCFADFRVHDPFTLRVLAVCGSLMTAWGALLDIREARRARANAQEIADLTQTNTQMDQLNQTLRMQRHDFLNHLQVVYSLMEMEEYKEATDYLDRVYGDIRAVSTVLKTKSAAVNALIKVKLGAAKDKGITLSLDIKSALEGLPMPSWELCRVLGNLLDNAMDAMQNAKQKQMSLTITEDLRQFRFAVENGGDMIPKELIAHIFEPGVTTKSQGHGMGLAIVRQTLKPYGGEVSCQSDENATRFTVTLPKANLTSAKE